VTVEETIRAAYDAWSRRDLDDILRLVHRDAEVRPVLGANLETDTYRGHDGVRHWMEDLHGEWATFEVTVTELVERGDRVLCAFGVHARGRASGIVIDEELFHVIEMRDGLIRRLHAFRDRALAVDAFEAT
jgi:ketosteroid isomerase-like protein